MLLSSLKSGESGRIIRIIEGDHELKLYEMGCLPGKNVIMKYIAPFGDPICIEVSGYDLAIRKSAAEQIEISPN